jgi:glycosyltransferase involved in cell wall biosynthesis
MTPERISIVIPVYKSEKTLVDLTNQLFACLYTHKDGLEIIFVNDASPDGSLEIIKELINFQPSIRIVGLDVNKGQQNAIIEGLRVATGELIVVMDADLQDKPEAIASMLSILDAHTDIVFVLRRGIYQSLNRMITSRIIKGAIQAITGLNKRAGTFFVMRKSVAERLVGLNVAHPHVPVMAHFCSKSRKYLDYERGFNQGVSAYTISKRILAARIAIMCSLECRAITARYPRIWTGMANIISFNFE